MEEKQILETAIAKYGAEAQLNQAVEEFAELIVAINKIRRKGGIRRKAKSRLNGIMTPLDYLYGKPTTESEFTVYKNNYNNLCEEVADVQIMLDQIKLMVDSEIVENYKLSKLERLKERLKP